MTDQKKVLALCVQTGEILLASGGEIFRVQETMERIARAYGACNFHVYVLTNGLFASVEDDGNVRNSEIRHIPTSSVHLGRVTAVNDLSRSIEAGRIALDDAFMEIEHIRALPYKPTALRVLACGVGAACFAYLFGGTVLDAGAALLTGFLLQCFSMLLARKGTNKIIYNIFSAALVALCSAVFAQILGFWGLVTNLDKIIIGGIIPLVPGMALTTSIRDFANGDYLSGTIRMMDALLVAGSIAIGVGTVLKLVAYLPGVSV